MIAKIYHVREPAFGLGPAPDFPAAYDLVAEVEAATPDEAFGHTNHIDSDWTRNPQVKRLHVPQARSTSVGDVVELDGHCWRCEKVGWEELRL
jgi:hypothetical protein